MSAIRAEPCSSCPYRRDVPPGVWAPHEYAKLVDYDAPTGEQPFAAFSCHATPDHFCHGWAVCHSNRGHDRELLALRLAGGAEVPEPAVPLFDSGAEAAEHGLSAVDEPPDEALELQERLMRKYERLRP